MQSSQGVYVVFTLETPVCAGNRQERTLWPPSGLCYALFCYCDASSNVPSYLEWGLAQGMDFAVSVNRADVVPVFRAHRALVSLGLAE